jgi:hypothetical protein
MLGALINFKVHFFVDECGHVEIITNKNAESKSILTKRLARRRKKPNPKNEIAKHFDRINMPIVRAQH